ncbi:SDR family NAD(P)-dependent oxidoreductase [Nocardiopsis quinghaiensis]|uniref:SDR family NAD(P)-dependent oxidoreductase n=1 Tax=Nocardiopsis quinghaiensis TaxID=464995 RepID=UPI001238A385|nr:SDR family oxidoreductase [Nocardiopsis quinghaiensis]
MERLHGKVVVVTGAARGQGAAAATALAEEGARVVALDVVGPEPPPPAGGAVVHRRLDVTDAEGWRALAAWLREEYGRVDGLVNNAGITLRHRLDEVDPADFDRVHAVNVTGPLLGVQSLLPLMPRGASIVNVGSVAALTGHYPVAYTASKWALRGLSAAASLELGPRGIRVNTLHPGFVETPMTASAPEAMRRASVEQTPLGRTGTVEDIAPLVVFLVSDESSFVTGAEIPVDGGYSTHGGAKAVSDALRQAVP